MITMILIVFYTLLSPTGYCTHKERLNTQNDVITSNSSNPHPENMIENISVILENLLKNYDQNERPGEFGEPTVIYTNVFIRSMGPFSDLKMEYSLDCYFRQHWIDQRLQFEGNGHVDDLALDISMLDKIWKPDTHFVNGLNSYLHTMTRPNKFLRIDQNGHISYSMRLTIKAKCPMELQNFPMDLQSCPLLFGSYAYTIDQVIYEWDPNVTEVDFKEGMLFTQFDVIDFPFRNTTRIERGREYSILQVNFNIRRYTGYFVIQIYIPCMLLVVLSWVSFWINREATADRVGLGVTTVLTMSTITLESRNDLPKVHYATAMDWFVIMSFVFVIATLLEFAGVHYFTKVGSGEMYEADIDEIEKTPKEVSSITKYHQNAITVDIANSENEQSETEENSINGGLNNLFCKCCRQFMHCIIANESYRISHRKARKESEFNSVSLIDRVSRVMFPITFFMLNVFYWMFYSSNRGIFSWDRQPH